MLLPLSWRPSVPSSTRVLQLDIRREEVLARLRSPRHSHCQGNFVVTASFALAPLPPTSAPPRLLPSWSVAGPWWQRLVYRHRTVPVSSALALRRCLALASLYLLSGIIATPEAGTSCTKPTERLATCPPILVVGHIHFRICLCSSVVEASALCGVSLMYYACGCATRCMSLVT